MSGSNEGLRDVSSAVRLRIDREGRWFYEDREIIHPAIYCYFNRCLQKEAGRYVIRTERELCTVEVEDAPFVVVQVERNERGEFVIHLNDGSRQLLSRESLWVGKKNVLYCTVKGGAFHARFLRSAYYQLAQHVEYEEKSGRFYVESMGKRQYIIEKEKSFYYDDIKSDGT